MIKLLFFLSCQKYFFRVNWEFTNKKCIYHVQHENFNYVYFEE